MKTVSYSMSVFILMILTSFTGQEGSFSANGDIEPITSKHDLKVYLERCLEQNDLPETYARSIIAIGLDEKRGVNSMRSINHPYSLGTEDRLLTFLKPTKWLAFENNSFFYLILEVEQGNVEVEFNLVKR